MKEEEGRDLPDEKIEAMLNHLKKEVPNIKCPSGNRTVKLCNNPKCKYALMCNDKKCKDCGKDVHRACPIVYLEDVTELINDRAEECRDFFLKLCRIEQEFIRSIHESQKDFLNRYSFGHGEAKFKETIRKIYQTDKYKDISGK